MVIFDQTWKNYTEIQLTKKNGLEQIENEKHKAWLELEPNFPALLPKAVNELST